MTVIMPCDQEPNNGDEESEEIARLVRDGVKPKPAKERLQLAAEKLSGNVPFGVDAPNKFLRKGIAGSAELLALAKFGAFGLLLVVFGALFLFVGLHGQFNVDLFSIGALLLILGIWSLRAAYKAGRNLRAISKV
jgi:hypothetical protein